MTISGSGYNFNPQPSIFQGETTAQNNLKNTGEMRGSVVIMPQSQSNDISFSKLDQRNKWDYNAEQGKPSLPPTTVFIGTEKQPDESSKLRYDDLLKQLPDDVLAELAGLPTVYTAALKFVLDLAANSLDWQDKAFLQTQTGNALNRANGTKNFPDTTYENSLTLGKEIAETVEKWVKKAGKNDPGFTENMDFVQDVKDLLKGLSNVNPKNRSAP